MQVKSLKGRLTLLSLIPFLFFLGVSLQVAWDSWTGYRNARHVSNSANDAVLISDLINSLQLERGKSSGFLGGSVPSSELETQVAQADGSFNHIASSLQDLALRESLSKRKEVIIALRSQVSGRKLNSDEAIKGYREFIRELISYEKALGDQAKSPNGKASLYSLISLEEGKENAGRLRANLTAVLSLNAPLSEDRLEVLLSSKGAIEANLNSPALYVSDGVRTKIEALATHPEWKDVNQTFRMVVALAQVGKYNADPKIYFAKISSVIKEMNVIVQEQLTFTKSIAETEKSQALQSLSLTLLSILVCSAVAFALSSLAIRYLSQALTAIAETLANGSQQMGGSISDISSSNTKLSESSVEQAAALQETVSAVDEINAMVGKNAEAAAHLIQTSQSGVEKTKQGRREIQSLLESMQAISHAGGEMQSQVKESSEHFAQITKMISEISSKTQMINDIVFQTKLLSFNASVEAARAGEHGKGFAVVAEEVGKLAQMSGNSAKEISTLLASSVDRVNDIVQKMTQRLETLVSNNQKQVVQGLDRAKRSGELFEQVSENTELFSKKVSEIATASQEQARGVQEISKAMQQLDQVTQQNSAVAQTNAQASGGLAHEARSLEKVVNELMALISGNAEKEQTSQSSDNEEHRLAA